VVPKGKAQLAKEHLERALPAVTVEDYTEAVTWLFLALEAAVTAIAERHGLSVESKHWQKLEVAEELRRQGHVSDDLAGAMRTLNEGRKAAVYEGEEPDLDGQSLEDLAALVESVVEIATGSES
jgi:hypothetical protein